MQNFASSCIKTNICRIRRHPKTSLNHDFSAHVIHELLLGFHRHIRCFGARSKYWYSHIPVRGAAERGVTIVENFKRPLLFCLERKEWEMKSYDYYFFSYLFYGYLISPQLAKVCDDSMKRMRQWGVVVLSYRRTRWGVTADDSMHPFAPVSDAAADGTSSPPVVWRRGRYAPHPTYLHVFRCVLLTNILLSFAFHKSRKFRKECTEGGWCIWAVW